MGVTGLWTVVQPCARPTNISTLNRKRLAVDASIWIYQFLKAVRDKEGNALRNSHVVGFFRRICKLLFHGIKPVFIFDGGAPALKRATIAARKRRREGRREDAVRTAGKLLAVQMQRRAEEEAQKRREEAVLGPGVAAQEEEPLPDNLVYVDQLQMTSQERQKNKSFKKKDQYHLPDLDVSLAEMGAPNDPRIMSLEELERYARQFDRGEDINVYDFSKIDFDSPFFTSLPASDRYNILNAARLRSRLRMGYSKEQLDVMFPNRMEFSKFQIERVKERNELTQRLMHINGMNGDDWMNTTGRVAGEKGREYVLVKNDGVEGGWALGVVTSKDEGQRNKPIDVDKQEPVLAEGDGSEIDEDDGFEDVPIEGLNRLPKIQTPQTAEARVVKQMAQKRQSLYASREATASRQRTHQQRQQQQETDSLFVAENSDEDAPAVDVLMYNVDEAIGEESFGRPYDEEEELQRAIALSLQSGQEPVTAPEVESTPEIETGPAETDDDYVEAFRRQTRVENVQPFSRGSALAIARTANARSSKAVVSTQDDSEDDDIEWQAALLASKKEIKTTDAIRSEPKDSPPDPTASSVILSDVTSIAGTGLFDGPLPFEKLNLGSSTLGKKKPRVDKTLEGGFVKADDNTSNKKAATPPPWFSTEITEALSKQRASEREAREVDKKHDEEFRFVATAGTLTPEVIDVDADEPQKSNTETEVIEINEDEDEEEIELDVSADSSQSRPLVAPKVAKIFSTQPNPEDSVSSRQQQRRFSSPRASVQDEGKLDGLFREEVKNRNKNASVSSNRNSAEIQNKHESPSDSEEEEFEDVPLQEARNQTPPSLREAAETVQAGNENLPLVRDDDDLFPEQDIEAPIEEEAADVYSDPEDEDLFKQLANEAEEHARFASTLNNRTTEENAVDYDRELRQLRSQQKRDRRDADEVTQTMIAECQQLLALFGLPYITAPMEAEAQCAELVSLGLVDGIVTDDSDIFLFGGTRVYKNMFNQAKFVECYLSADLESEFSLTREKLIAIAQLLGSDYTEGLPGVGPVTALEIISEFGSLDAFKVWWESVQNGSRPKSADQGNPFRRKFRRNSTKIFLPTSFPDARVADAYLHPEVDNDATAFIWGIPDLNALREFLMSTIGWSQARTDEILVPVIKDMNQRNVEGTQSNITNFFSGGVGAGAFAPRVRAQGNSKRLANALTRMAEKERGNGDRETEQADEYETTEERLSSRPAKRNKRTKTRS